MVLLLLALRRSLSRKAGCGAVGRLAHLRILPQTPHRFLLNL